MPNWFKSICVLAIVTTLLGPFGREALAVTPAKVEEAIQKGKACLYALQNKEGNWEVTQSQGPVRVDDSNEKDHGSLTSWQWGGPTALATYALLAAGERPDDPRLAKAIAFMKKNRCVGIYAAGMRAQIWTFLPPSEDVRKCIKEDAKFLDEALLRKGKAKGFYCYHKLPPKWEPWYDRSVSQYGVLGMWACAQSGIEVPTSYWSDVDAAWKGSQKDDGGWSYNDFDKDHPDNTQVKPSMTAAGIATLFITQDYRNTGQGINCTGNAPSSEIDKGLKWMADHFPLKKKDDWCDYYTLYGIERIGVASGYRYFGDVDWYQRGADFLMIHQNAKNGGWDMGYSNMTSDINFTCATSWGILFLVRGRAPVVMNKLQYELPDKDGKIALGMWNQRPRDVANLAAWIGKRNERYFNWQIVTLKSPVEELADAPILYISGNQDLAVAAADSDKLKQFVEQGGIVLGNADCANKAFADSFRKFGQKLFPAYEFRELPADHPIYTEQQYPRSKWKNPPSVLGLSNGARELMLLLPTADVGRAWQMQDSHGKAETFQLGSNIYLYAIEKQTSKYKGETHVITRAAGGSGRSVKVARLQYAGNWDPEPGGWRRLSNLLHNKNKIDLTIDPVTLGAGKLDASYKVAHLTGTSAFKFSAAQQGEIKKYIDGGGTIIIDAAGGSTAFAASAENELATIFPEAGKTIPPIDKSHASVANVSDLELRKFTMKTLGKSRPPLPRGIESNGRVRVFYSPLDLSVGIVGQPVDGVAGYSPEAATNLMQAIVAYASKG